MLKFSGNSPALSDLGPKEKIRHISEMMFIFLLCLVSIIFPILAYNGILMPAGHTVGEWFERSGAIMSIFSSFAQFRAGGFLESMRGGTFAESWTAYRIFKKYLDIASWIIAFLVILGAGIWGYGSLMIE
jgi:hypothetical protein